MIGHSTFCTFMYISKAQDTLPSQCPRTGNKSVLPIQDRNVGCPSYYYHQLNHLHHHHNTSGQHLLSTYYVLCTVTGSLNALTHLINHINFYISCNKKKVNRYHKIINQKKKISGEKKLGKVAWKWRI